MVGRMPMEQHVVNSAINRERVFIEVPPLGGEQVAKAVVSMLRTECNIKGVPKWIRARCAPYPALL